MTSYVFQVDDFALYRYFTGRYQTVRCAKVTCVRVQCPGRIQIGARHPPPPPFFFALACSGVFGGWGFENNDKKFKEIAQIGNNCYFILKLHAIGPAPMFFSFLLNF